MKYFCFLLSYFHLVSISNCLGNLIILDKESDLNPSWSTSTSCTYGEIYSDFNKLQCKISPASNNHHIHTEGFWTPCQGQECELNYKFNNTKAFVPNKPGKVRVNGFISGNASIEVQVEDPKMPNKNPMSVGRLYIVDHWSEESFDIMNITENMILKIIIGQNASLSSDDMALLDKVVIESSTSRITEQTHSSSTTMEKEVYNELPRESTTAMRFTPTTTDFYNINSKNVEVANSLELKEKDEDIIQLPLEESQEPNSSSLPEPEPLPTPPETSTYPLESNIIEVSTTTPVVSTKVLTTTSIPSLPEPSKPEESVSEPIPEFEVSPEPEILPSTDLPRKQMDDSNPLPEGANQPVAETSSDSKPEPEPGDEPTAEPQGESKPKPEANSNMQDESANSEPETEKEQADEPTNSNESVPQQETNSENKSSLQEPASEKEAISETESKPAPDVESKTQITSENGSSPPKEEPVPEPEDESKQEPTPEAGLEKSASSEPEPAPEPEGEPKQEPAPESEAEKSSASEPEGEPKHEPAPEAEPEKSQAPKPEGEPKQEPVPESEKSSSSEPEGEPKHEPAPEAEPEKSPSPEPENQDSTQGPRLKDIPSNTKITSKNSDSPPPVTEAYEAIGRKGSPYQASTSSLALYIGIPVGTVLIISGLGLLFFMKKKRSRLVTDTQITDSP